MDPLPPDPYKALGLTKDADAAAIKSTYRKLVLKCHPDKVKDESRKLQAQEDFHKIQQAWELIGDEDKRNTYDAAVRLDSLRREKLARNGPSVDVKAARYDVRTAAPASATFSSNGSSRYEERKTSRSFDEARFYNERAKKFDTYDPYPKHSSSRISRTEKEIPIKVTRVSVDRTRSDHKKTRDREERRDRSGKFVHIEEDMSSNDEKARYESDYLKRTSEEETRRLAADARRKAEDRRSYEEPAYNHLTNEAMRHIQRTKTEVADPRPSPTRTTSSRDVRPADTYDRSSRRDRPEPVRRSSARPKEVRPATSTGRDRDRDRDRDRKGFPEIVEWDEDDRKPPSFKHSSSSPAEIHVPSRTAPKRSYTEAPSREHRRVDTSPTPVFRRSETMPSSHTSSRRKEATPVRPSLLRSSETLSREPRSHSPEATYATVPPPQSASSKKYYYPTPGGGVRLSTDDVGVANGHRTVVHEPTRHRARSPSPISRPPMGPNRPSHISSTHYQPTTAPKLAIPHPPLGRSATTNIGPSRDDRGRTRPSLYGEVHKRENTRRQNSFSPDTVSYSMKPRPEDISWSEARNHIEKDREYAKPTLSRYATSVY